jgi:hypothetical protein
VLAVIVETVLNAVIIITISPPVLLPPPINHQHQPLLIVVFLLAASHSIYISPPSHLDDGDLSSPLVPPQPHCISQISCLLLLSLLRHPPIFIVACRQVIIDSCCLQKAKERFLTAQGYSMQDMVSRESPHWLHVLTTPAAVIARIEWIPEGLSSREES